MRGSLVRFPQGLRQDRAGSAWYQHGALKRDNSARGIIPTLYFFASFRIRIARWAALSPLSTPTHATGTPFGIWAIESRASRPLRVPLTGTPITGLSVFDAITPGSAAESPAMAIKILHLLALM